MHCGGLPISNRLGERVMSLRALELGTGRDQGLENARGPRAGSGEGV